MAESEESLQQEFISTASNTPSKGLYNIIHFWNVQKEQHETKTCVFFFQIVLSLYTRMYTVRNRFAVV